MWIEDANDQKIWDSGLALAAWLRRRLGLYQAGDLEADVSDCLGLLSGQKVKGTCRILELGTSLCLMTIHIH